MLYVKAIIIGLGSALLAAVLLGLAELVVPIAYLFILSASSGGGAFSFYVGIGDEGGFDVREGVPFVIAALVGFLIGFAETVRRGRRTPIASE